MCGIVREDLGNGKVEVKWVNVLECVFEFRFLYVQVQRFVFSIDSQVYGVYQLVGYRELVKINEKLCLNK